MNSGAVGGEKIHLETEMEDDREKDKPLVQDGDSKETTAGRRVATVDNVCVHARSPEWLNLGYAKQESRLRTESTVRTSSHLRPP